MSKPTLRSEIRQARVERLADAKQSPLLSAPWLRRTLSLVTVISSYVILATLLIPTPYWVSKTGRIYRDSQLEDTNPIYGIRDRAFAFALIFLIWGFILLRISLRRNTFLPEQYLSKLQVTNRDWAFKAGYAVARRAVLGIAALFALLAMFGESLTGFTAGYGPTPKAFRAFETYLSDLSMEDPFGFYFKLFSLIAFMAYSLPIVLLAWREARFPQPVAVPQEVKELSKQASDAKLYFDSLKWLVLFLAVLGTCLTSQQAFFVLGVFFLPLMTLFVYIVVPGSLFLFVWASIKVSKGVMSARNAGFISVEQRRWANLTTLFLTTTLVLGLTVGAVMVISISGLAQQAGWPDLPIAVLAGLLMIPAQALSMTFYAKLESKEETSSLKLW
jgi:hypothetical protein